ncbi:MAG: hypothetical protein ABJM43_09455 [Paracoccaceae bacterium]
MDALVSMTGGRLSVSTIYLSQTKKDQRTEQMSSSKTTDYISLAHAMQCILSGLEFLTDATKPTIRYHFPDQDQAFEELLHALMEDKIRALGTLSVVDLDLPALEGHIDSSDLLTSCLNWRRKGEIILASGSESVSVKVPPDSWWCDGVIWEQSTLRVNDPYRFEERADKLKVERHVPYLPERPYGFERAVCFSGLKFELEELLVWSNSRSLARAPRKKANPRGAGMKPTEDYRPIETHLWKLVNQDQEWQNWQQVWGNVRHLFNDPDGIEKSNPEQPYKKLTAHLSSNDPVLLDALRARIVSVKRR